MIESAIARGWILSALGLAQERHEWLLRMFEQTGDFAFADRCYEQCLIIVECKNALQG